MEVKVKLLSRVQLFATPWTNVAHQALPSMGFSRHEYWSGLPFPSPGDLLDPGIEPRSPALQADTLTSEPPGKPKVIKFLYCERNDWPVRLAPKWIIHICSFFFAELSVWIIFYDSLCYKGAWYIAECIFCIKIWFWYQTITHVQCVFNFFTILTFQYVVWHFFPPFSISVMVLCLKKSEYKRMCYSMFSPIPSQ